MVGLEIRFEQRIEEVPWDLQQSLLHTTTQIQTQLSKIQRQLKPQGKDVFRDEHSSHLPPWPHRTPTFPHNHFDSDICVHPDFDDEFVTPLEANPKNFGFDGGTLCWISSEQFDSFTEDNFVNR